MFGKDKKKDKKKESKEEVTVEETAAAPEVKEEVSAHEVKEARVTKTEGGYKFKSTGHQKLYDKLDPESRYAKNLVKRFAI